MLRNRVDCDKLQCLNVNQKKLESNKAEENSDVETIDKCELIMNNHEQLGHANQRTTYNFMKGQYYWNTMREDVGNVIQACKNIVFNEK